MDAPLRHIEQREKENRDARKRKESYVHIRIVHTCTMSVHMCTHVAVYTGSIITPTGTIESKENANNVIACPKQMCMHTFHA